MRLPSWKDTERIVLGGGLIVYAIADRLAQPEGAWQKFDRRGWRALVFPDWRRG